jgi:hypothetical protein
MKTKLVLLSLFLYLSPATKDKRVLHRFETIPDILHLVPPPIPGGK